MAIVGGFAFVLVRTLVALWPALALRVPGPRIVMASALGAACAVAMLALARHPALAVAATVAIAAGLAGIFPTVLGIVGARYAAYTGTVFGILFTAALTGGVTLPWLTGQLAAARGLRSALWLTVACFLAVGALQWAAARRMERTP